MSKDQVRRARAAGRTGGLNEPCETLDVSRDVP